jgi:hypothetical protein
MPTTLPPRGVSLKASPKSTEGITIKTDFTVEGEFSKNFAGEGDFAKETELTLDSKFAKKAKFAAGGKLAKEGNFATKSVLTKEG